MSNYYQAKPPKEDIVGANEIKCECGKIVDKYWNKNRQPQKKCAPCTISKRKKI